MSNDPLFRDRVPEAAARQLAVALASATEWHLATLEQLHERKSSSKRDIRRQTNICNELVLHCRELGISPWRGLRGYPCTRLADRIAIATNSSSEASPPCAS